jgi:hypothetical protein
MDEDRLHVLAVVIIVAIGLAYMGWLVLTFLEERETGMTIRRVVTEHFANQPKPEQAPVVDAEVVSD